MRTGYTHSEAFAVLKDTKEKVKKNLTSFQYLSVLDNHLYAAVENLVENTRFFDMFLSQVLAWQTSNPKRKSCGVGRHELANLVTKYFLMESAAEKMRLVRQMKLYRNILTEVVNRWLDVVKDYVTLADRIGDLDAMRSLQQMQEMSMLRHGHSLHSTYTQVTYWAKHASVWKEAIIQKYTRMTLNAAQRDYVQLGHPMHLSDFVQIYMMHMSKAIDKCDTDKGVITSHIGNWLLSAKNVAQSQAIDGYVKGSEHRVSHVGLEDVELSSDETPYDTEEREQEIQRVRYIAKIFDPSGIGRLALGIQEQLTAAEIQELRAHALKEDMT